MPQFPGLPAGFQPYPEANVQPPVIPAVIPSSGTPHPSFPITMPQPQHQQPTIIVNPGQVMPGTVPMIPRDEYHPSGPGPYPSSRPGSAQRPPFIPSDLSRSSSEADEEEEEEEPLPIEMASPSTEPSLLSSVAPSLVSSTIIRLVFIG